MRSWIQSVCVTIGVAGLTLGVCCARAADEKDDDAKKLSEADVPQKVMDAVKARFPGAKVASAERENEDGMVIYDIELTAAGGRKYEADLKEDGAFIEIEKALDAKDYPASVTDAVKAKWPGAKIKEVMEKSLVTDGKETVHEYEVVLQVGDKEQEVTLSKDGKVVEEAAGEEKGDDKGKDEGNQNEKK